MAAKLVHQIQIAVVSAMLHATISNDSKIGVSAQIDGINQAELDKLLQISIDDLCLLFKNYCVLYGQDFFFKINASKSACDVIVCIGQPKLEAPATIMITDISTTRTIENAIPTNSDLQIAEVDENTLLYFLDYVFHYDCFREGQLAGIERLLNGQDSIVLLPTGSGKSLIYQLASLICPGKIIVVSSACFTDAGSA